MADKIIFISTTSQLTSNWTHLFKLQRKHGTIITSAWDQRLEVKSCWRWQEQCTGVYMCLWHVWISPGVFCESVFSCYSFVFVGQTVGEWRDLCPFSGSLRQIWLARCWQLSCFPPPHRLFTFTNVHFHLTHFLIILSANFGTLTLTTSFSLFLLLLICFLLSIFHFVPSYDHHLISSSLLLPRSTYQVFSSLNPHFIASLVSHFPFASFTDSPGHCFIWTFFLIPFIFGKEVKKSGRRGWVEEKHQKMTEKTKRLGEMTEIKPFKD